MLELKDNITKEYILDKISQIDIFSKYLNIPISEISWCIENNGLIAKLIYN